MTVAAVALAAGWHGFLPVLPTAVADLPATPALRELVAGQGTDRGTAGGAIGGPQVLVPNTGEYFGLRDPRGRGVPTLDRTMRAWGALGGAAGANLAFVDPSDPAAARVLRVFGVRSAMVTHGAPRPAQSTLVHAGRDADVYALRGTLPRASFTCRWDVAPSKDAAHAALDRATVSGLRERPIVEAAPSPAGCTTPATAAQIIRDEATRVTIDVVAPTGGRVVLRDTYYPGWRATVDGRPVPIAPTDVAFRSIPVPAGRHHVEFRYAPSSVRRGLVLSGLAWAGILVLAAWAIAGRRLRTPRGSGGTLREVP